MIAVVLNEAGFQRDFTALIDQAKRPIAVLKNVGQEAKNQLVRHFREKDRNEPNKLGGPRRHYWIGVANSVQNPVVEGDTQVRISITEPTFAQKYFGGRITAKNARMLTIPQTPEAYGRTAETFEAEEGVKLFVLKGSRMAGLAARFPDGQLVVEYVLKPWVDQAADPTALPEMSEGSPFLQALLARGQSVVDRQNAEANAKN
jgi:hypothetical protein